MKAETMRKMEGTLLSVFLLIMVGMCCFSIVYTVNDVVLIGLIFAGISFLTLIGTTLLYRNT